MRQKQNGKEEEQEEEVAVKIWDCGSPLYDSYELATLGHVIDRHTMTLPSPCGSYRFSFRLEKRVKTTSFSKVRSRRKVAGGKEKAKKKGMNGLFGLLRVRLLFMGPAH